MSTMLCAFKVDGDLYGVPVEWVQEVIRQTRLTPVPRADAHIAGLINLRGQVVCGIDMRTRLGKDDGATPVAVVAFHSGGTAALLVDSIADVTVVDEASFEPPPSTVPAHIRELLHGVYKLGDELLCVLDVDRVVREA